MVKCQMIKFIPGSLLTIWSDLGITNPFTAVLKLLLPSNPHRPILKEYMQWDSIEIEINLKLGNDAFKCYTCDFTHDYIDINADYRN